MNSSYKKIYETYGLTVCSRIVGQSKEHVCRYAKKNNWKSPSNDEIADQVIRLIQSPHVI